MTDTVRVETNTKDGTVRRRTLFEGLEADARRFITDNFPRMHLENGETEAVPDVHLVHGNGDKEHFDGNDWVAPKKDDQTPENTPDVKDAPAPEANESTTVIP